MLVKICSVIPQHGIAKLREIFHLFIQGVPEINAHLKDTKQEELFNNTNFLRTMTMTNP